MAGIELRKAGTTADRAPLIKRGLVTLSDGRLVALAIDANQASSSATDQTGVAKIYLHLSTNSNRTAFTQAIAYTPPVAPCSPTFTAVASMGAGADNSVWVVWQGVDNGLYMSRWSYSAGVFTFVSTTTVQAASAVVNRFRRVDIDVTGNATPVIGTYEALASNGQGMQHRIYVLMNDGTTWRRVLNMTGLASPLFILANSEDVSIAVRGDGVVSNVVRMLFYGTKSATTGDQGDVITEVSFNVSSGAADSGTRVGTWFSDLNMKQAIGTRRGFIFTLSSTIWLFAGVVGTSVPKFFATKLTSGNWSKPAITTVGYVASVALSNFFKIDPSYNPRTSVSATYKDNRLIFGFASVGTGLSPRISREIVFSYASLSAVNAAPTVDSVPRPLDSNFYGGTGTTLIPGGGPIALYGGDNRRVAAGLKSFNFTCIYGIPGDTVGTNFSRSWRYIGEDTFDAPFLMSPRSSEPVTTAFPTFRVKVENLSLTPNLYGKIHVQVSEDFSFLTGVTDIIQPDSALQYFGSKDGLSTSAKEVFIKTPSTSPLLNFVPLYWRARIVSDKDTPGVWSESLQMGISHPPIAIPVTPAPNQVVLSNGGDVFFDWLMSDTEPTDTQLDYQVIIKRTDTDTIIVDTGIVASSVTSAAIAISNTYLDVPLSWTVQLTDAGGEFGPVSSPVNFTMSTAPTVAITSPPDLSTVTTAAPTVSWTFTPVASRAQRAYRVRVMEDFQNSAIANSSFEVDTSGWIATGCSAVRDSTFAHLGTYSALITPDGVTANPRIGQVYSAGLGTQFGSTVTAKGWIRPTNAAKDVEIGIDWYDNMGVLLSSTVQAFPATAAAWQELEITATAPSGTWRAAARIGMLNTPAGADVAYVDQMRIYHTFAAQGETIGDSGWQSSAATSYAFTSNILEEGKNYSIRVDVQDTGGLTAFATSGVVTDWTEPALGNITSISNDSFKVVITWDDSTQDADFVAWRVYRRYMATSIAELDVTNTRNTWVLIHEEYEPGASFTYNDYTCPLNIPTDYVVVQLADRFGSLVESNITDYETVIQDADRYFFIPEVAVGTIASFEASEVVADQFTREIEQETLNVVGRGRQVQIGEDLGYIGSLSLHLRNPNTARMVREFFEILSADNNKVFIKSPFGDVVLAAIGNIATGRQAGYGRADIADITVPYSEVFQDEQVTRLSVEP